MPDSRSDRSCARWLKLVADETRLAVVEQLLDGPKHVGGINAALGIDQSLLSHHLKVLRDGGLVTAERDGRSVRYRLADEARVSGRGIDFGCCLLSFEDAP